MKEHWLYFRAAPSITRPGGLIVTVQSEAGESSFYPSVDQVRDLIATLQLGLDRLDEAKTRPAEAAA